MQNVFFYINLNSVNIQLMFTKPRGNLKITFAESKFKSRNNFTKEYEYRPTNASLNYLRSDGHVSSSSASMFLSPCSCFFQIEKKNIRII